MTDPNLLSAWVAHVFDHPVTQPAWYELRNAPSWEGEAFEIATLLAETFERSGELLARFSDEQLDQGLWFMGSCEGAFWALAHESPWPARERGIKSILSLFEQVIAPRCPPALSEIGEHGSALNSACYMFWDFWNAQWMMLHPPSTYAVDHVGNFEATVFEVLRQILAIPHDACRESAIHGLGHFHRDLPKQAGAIIDEFLATSRDIRPELRAYALKAREGQVQ